MPKKKRTPARPRDTNQLAKLVVELATHEVTEATVPLPDERAVKRGQARAAALSAGERKRIAKQAAQKRWKGGN